MAERTMVAPNEPGPAHGLRRRFLSRHATGVALAVAFAVGTLTAGCAPRAAEVPARPLRIAIADRPLGLDPHLNNDFLTGAVLANGFEGLTRFDRDFRIEPCLAATWETPDPLTWRFHLRPGVRFHDGRPLRAADVVASLERARHHPRSCVTSYLVAVAAVRELRPGDGRDHHQASGGHAARQAVVRRRGARRRP